MRSLKGGIDSVDFQDSVLDDIVYSVAEFTSMRNDLGLQRADGFRQISLVSDAGGYDTVEMHGTSGVDEIALVNDRGSYVGG